MYFSLNDISTPELQLTKNKLAAGKFTVATGADGNINVSRPAYDPDTGTKVADAVFISVQPSDIIASQVDAQARNNYITNIRTAVGL
jgi:hypothetical protein